MTTSVPPQGSPTAPPRYQLAIVTWAAVTILFAAFKPLGRATAPQLWLTRR